MAKPKVLVACCNGSGWLRKEVAEAAMRMAADSRFHVTWTAPTRNDYVHNLHGVVNLFLEGDWDFLLNMDDDNPPTRNPLDLVAEDLDVVGLPTPVWHNAVPGDRPYYFNTYMLKPGTDGYMPAQDAAGFYAKGFQRVDAVGTGCVLIARRVLATLMRRCKGNPMEAPFMRRWNDRGEAVRGNDLAFCERVKAAGFEIWTNYDYPCSHFVERDLIEVIGGFAGMREQPSA